MESGVLFKKGYLIPMLRCVGPLQANYVIREIHMGSCGMHVGPREVVRKAMRQDMVSQESLSRTMGHNWNEGKQPPYEKPDTSQKWNSTTTRSNPSGFRPGEFCIEGMRASSGGQGESCGPKWEGPSGFNRSVREWLLQVANLGGQIVPRVLARDQLTQMLFGVENPKDNKSQGLINHSEGPSPDQKKM
ncbi:hypothetical protein Tco_0852902 [Tanacetum coccineum]